MITPDPKNQDAIQAAATALTKRLTESLSFIAQTEEFSALEKLYSELENSDDKTVIMESFYPIFKESIQNESKQKNKIEILKVAFNYQLIAQAFNSKLIEDSLKKILQEKETQEAFFGFEKNPFKNEAHQQAFTDVFFNFFEGLGTILFNAHTDASEPQKEKVDQISEKLHSLEILTEWKKNLIELGSEKFNTGYFNLPERTPEIQAIEKAPKGKQLVALLKTPSSPQSSV